MAGFVAADAVEAMEYDFTGFGGSAGVIPEPSTDGLEKFQEAMRVATSKIGITIKDTSAETLAASLDELSGAGTGAARSVRDAMIEAVAVFCQQTPSAADLDRLPFRVFQAFVGWLLGCFRPEAETPGTKR